MTVPAPDCGIPTPAEAWGGDAEARHQMLSNGGPGPLELAAREVLASSPELAEALGLPALLDELETERRARYAR